MASAPVRRVLSPPGNFREAPLTDTASYLNNTGDGDESTIKSAIGSAIVSEKLTEIVEAMEIETTDEYDNITAYNVNTYLPFAQDAYVSDSGSAGSATDEAPRRYGHHGHGSARDRAGARAAPR